MLDGIPWRISCEFYLKGTKLHWIESWIKIGWWDDNHEISSHLQKGTWYEEEDPEMGITSSQFKSVVWSGCDHTMIHKLLKHDGDINIEYRNDDGYFVPINAAFKKCLDHTHIFDMTKLEIGNLSNQYDNDLDAFRILQRKEHNTDESTYSYFKGNHLAQSCPISQRERQGGKS